MRRFLATACAVVLFALPTRADDLFVSPAVDPQLFNPQALRRVTREIGAWSFVCDEILRLRKRLCSVSTVLRDEAGAPVGAFLVSTDEKGKPAALLRFLAPIAVGRPVELQIAFDIQAKDKRARTVRRNETSRIDYCDRKLCTAFVYLRDEMVFALSAGRDIAVVYAAPEAAAAGWRLSDPVRSKTVYLRADGFAQALKATTQ